MERRYERNIGTLSIEEQKLLQGKRVCIVGCGGLGGYILEYFLRLGIGAITVLDGDRMEESNWNRQILCTEKNLGCKKAEEAKKRALEINTIVKVKEVSEFLTKENAEELLKNHDLILDALDNIQSRKWMGEACRKLKIPIIYGAIEGWYAQISLIMPDSNLLDILYQEYNRINNKSTLSFVPALCASYQVAEAVKYLCGKSCILENKVLYVDLFTMDTEIISLS